MSFPKVTVVKKNHTSYHIFKSSISSFCNFVHAKFVLHCVLQNNFTLIEEREKNMKSSRHYSPYLSYLL